MTTTRALLGGTRAAVGTLAWVAPDHAARAFGIDPGRSDRFIGRLFGSRELALAAALLTAPPAHLRTVATIGAAIDAADAIAGLDERRRGTLSTWALISGALGAVAFSAMGVAVARQARPA